MGLLISWAAPACNNPLFAEIVPPHLRSMIYAFDRSFETAIAASAAPVVGLLAEQVFGWQVWIELLALARIALADFTENENARSAQEQSMLGVFSLAM